MIKYEFRKTYLTKKTYLIVILMLLAYLGLMLYNNRFWLGQESIGAEYYKEECIRKNETRKNTVEYILNSNSSDVSASYYTEEKNDWYGNYSKAGLLLENMKYGFFAQICLILIICNSFSIESITGMRSLTAITKKGKMEIYQSKLYVAILAVLPVLVLFFIEYLIVNICTLKIGADIFGCPLYMIEGYEMCASGLSVRNVIVCQLLMAVPVTLLTAVLTLYFSKLIKIAPFAALSSMVFVGISMFMDFLNNKIYSGQFDTDSFRLMSEVTFMKLYECVKSLNPFSLLDSGYYYVKPRFTFLGRMAWTNYTFPIVISILLTGIFATLTIYTKKVHTGEMEERMDAKV